MKKTMLRLCSLLLCFALLFSLTVLPISAENTESGDESVTENAESTAEDYSTLYVQDADGDGESDLSLLWYAFDKSADDTVAEALFTVSDTAVYGDGYLTNNTQSIVLTDYLPNKDVVYTADDGSEVTHTVQNDFTVELVMSSHAPKESGTGNTVDNGSNYWYLGNLPMRTSYRQSEHEKLAKGPIGGYISNYHSNGNGTSLNVYDGARRSLFGKNALEQYTIAFSFDFENLGESLTDDTVMMRFFTDMNDIDLQADAGSAVFRSPLVYNPADENDKLEIGLGCYYFNWYAIRIYSAVLSEAQMKQNHFADLASYFSLPLDTYFALDEDIRANVHELAATIRLTDTDGKEKLEAALHEAYLNSFYVRDVDGDGESDLAFVWNAYAKTADDAVAESAFTPSADAVYGDGYLTNNTASIVLTDYLPNISYNGSTAQDDYSIELVMASHAPKESGAGNTVNNGSNYWYLGNIRLRTSYRQSEHEKLAKGPISGYINDYNSNGNGTSLNVYDGARRSLFGATALVPYTVTATFDTTLTGNVASDTMQVTFYRDAQNIDLQADSSSSVWRNPLAYSATDTNDKLEVGLGCYYLNWYAIRVYSAILSEAQMKQNHFADILSYHRPANMDLLSELSPIGLESVMTSCETLPLLGADTARALTDAINDAYALEKGEVYLPEYFMSFEGYSMRMFGENALRVTFTVDTDYIDALSEDVRLVELGVLRTPVGYEYGNNSLKKTALTVEYAEKNSHAEKEVFYTDGDTLSEHYSMTVNLSDDMQAMSEEMMFRGYIVLELNGACYTIYEETVSPTFGDRISFIALSAAVYKKETHSIDNLNPEGALRAYLVGANALLDTFEARVESAKNARSEAEKNITDARTDAYALKASVSALALAGSESGADTEALKEQTATLMQSAATIKAKAESVHPMMAEEMTAVSESSTRLTSLTALAAEALGEEEASALAERAEAVYTAAAEESKAQEGGFSNAIRRKSVDALDAIAVAETVAARIAKDEFGEVKTLRVLAIGNSFSNNSMTYLYKIAHDLGYEDVILGNLYIANCTVSRHLLNAKNNLNDYSYRKNTGDEWHRYEKSTLYEALTDEPWDIVTFQQASHDASQESTLTDGKLDELTAYVAQNATNANVSFRFHMTWAYADGHNHPYKDKEDYAFLNDQDEMDRLIAETVTNAILTREDMDGIIPAGAAIRTAREHFGYGFELYTYPDGYHLNYKGCFIIGLTWFAALTGQDISDASDVGDLFSTDEDLAAAIDAAKAAIENPFAVLDVKEENE